ncbi:AMP-binding protein [Sphingopyxis sp. JAI128]|uniref:AMP-binding protein n=1 Tax=Sphingopyxis sp. JAI128 TaxID=2723066 RepID=UPI001616032E|nr:AMP-binding protein [Sphingopyxis sp. JAI128]MBB6426911.1 acyl-CoA synthetase (AMP-forming)/AMP-acid ligase II/acetyl esterase/lipase [Sphingopyxis sp. JAI128]
MTGARSPELEAAIAHIRSAIAAARTDGGAWSEYLRFPRSVLPPGLTVTRMAIGAMPCEWIEPRGCDRSVRVLLLHGGGFVEGGLGSHRHFAVTLAEVLNRPVLVIDYRLAPQDPYPAALDDCMRAQAWLWENDIAGATPASQLYVVGDSAGGNLALATALRTRDEGLAAADGLVLISPWNDLAMGLPSHAELESEDFLLGSSLGRLCRAIAAGRVSPSDHPYLAGHPVDDPLVSPLLADIAGLPPTLCLVAEEEMLLDDSLLLAERAAAAAVPFKLVRVPGVFHAWPVFGRLFPEAVAAIETIANEIHDASVRTEARRTVEVERDLSEYIAIQARRRGAAIAVVEGDRTLTWRAFDARIGGIAAWLSRRGIGPDSCVATVSDNSIEHLLLLCAALRCGAAIVPLPSQAGPGALSRMIDDSGAMAIGIADSARPDLDPARLPGIRLALDFEAPGWTSIAEIEDANEPLESPIIDPDSRFDIIYSSGTTGAPKGIVHSRRTRFREYSGSWGLGFSASSVTLVSTPFYSNTTFAGLLPTLAFGGTLIIMRRFDAREFLRLAERHHVTHAMIVPVQIQRLLAQEDFDQFDLSAFQMKMCTSAPLSTGLKQAMRERWPGGFFEFYGMTEGGVVCALDIGSRPDKLATVGQPLPGGELRIIDENGKELPAGEVGEIVGRSAVMMDGYHRRAEATAEASWIDAQGARWQRTGDLGRVDDEGFLTLLDRRKDMIISGGFNIYAADLEAELRRHEAIEDVAVIGIPSERWGETPLALVVLKQGASDSPQMILDAINPRLGKMQRLAGVEIRPELPRNALGKILKRVLRAPYWEKANDA